MKKYTFALSVLFVMIISLRAYSQLPNMILLEEATNASCPPCASQNPYLEQFLQDNAGFVIGVSYHAWWPGSTDPMNTGDFAMNKNRIIYYGFDQIGVPTCVINGKYTTPSSGWYKGAPGDINALSNSINDAEGNTVPITMMINRYTQNDSEQVRVTVTSTVPITNNYLRVIVTEGEHDYSNAGTNGETVFPHIARKMLPNYTGSKINLSANETKSFIFKYKYDTKWTTDQLSIIAFIQSDADSSVAAAVQSVDPPSNGFLAVPSVGNIAGFNISLHGNPVGANQTIDYTLGGNLPLKMTFSVIDLLGRSVLPNYSELITPGQHSFDLHSADLSAGVYHLIARTSSGFTEIPFIVEH